MISTPRQTFWQCPLRLNINVPHDPVISLLGIYPRDGTAYVHQKICLRMFIATLFKIAKTGKTPMFISRLIGKYSWHIRTMKYYAGSTKNKLLTHRNIGGLTDVKLSKRSQSTKEYVAFELQEQTKLSDSERVPFRW